MFKVLGLALVILMVGCAPDATSDSQWDGTYIGYYHHNQQDTIPVTLVFEGKYFAASPYGSKADSEASGVFQENSSNLIFHNTTGAAPLVLSGSYQYQFSTDGSVRIWKQEDGEVKEMILRQR